MRNLRLLTRRLVSERHKGYHRSCHCWGIVARRPGNPSEQHAWWCPVRKLVR